MILLANILIGVSYILGSILFFYTFIVLAYVIMSWVNADPYNPLVRVVHGSVEPLIYQIKKYIPTRIGMIDFAPFILLLLLQFTNIVLVKTLEDYGHKLKGPSYVINTPSYKM
jgi:YggT family protein